MWKSTQPRISVFCRCGAEWHGKHAVDNPVIDAHRKRRACGLCSLAEFRARGHHAHFPTGWTDADIDQACAVEP